MKKLLGELENVDNRKARFRTVFTLIIDGKTQFFEGICNGDIIREKRGGEGFGYDPIFYVPEFGMTTAQMTKEQKNSISHRGKASRAMAEKLKAELG